MSDTPPEGEPPIRHLRQLIATSYKLLGYSRAAVRLGAEEQQLYGKWCGRCEGIWFGLALEVECPRCGNRKG